MPSTVPEVRELLAFHYDCLQGMYFSSHEKVNGGDLLFSEEITDPYYNFLAPTTSQPVPKAISDEFVRRNRQPAIYLTSLADPRHPDFKDLAAWAQDAWLVATTDTLAPTVEHDPGLTMGIVGPQDRERYVAAFAMAYSGDDPQDPYGQLDPAYSSCLRESFEHHSPEFRKYYVIATQGTAKARSQ